MRGVYHQRKISPASPASPEGPNAEEGVLNTPAKKLKLFFYSLYASTFLTLT